MKPRKKRTRYAQIFSILRNLDCPNQKLGFPVGTILRGKKKQENKAYPYGGPSKNRTCASGFGGLRDIHFTMGPMRKIL